MSSKKKTCFAQFYTNYYHSNIWLHPLDSGHQLRWHHIVLFHLFHTTPTIITVIVIHVNIFGWNCLWEVGITSHHMINWRQGLWYFADASLKILLTPCKCSLFHYSALKYPLYLLIEGRHHCTKPINISKSFLIHEGKMFSPLIHFAIKCQQKKPT